MRPVCRDGVGCRAMMAAGGAPASAAARVQVWRLLLHGGSRRGRRAMSVQHRGRKGAVPHVQRGQPGSVPLGCVEARVHHAVGGGGRCGCLPPAIRGRMARGLLCLVCGILPHGSQPVERSSAGPDGLVRWAPRASSSRSRWWRDRAECARW
jgi:hypothetical protein